MLRAALPLLSLLLMACQPAPPESLRETRPLMGTVVEIAAEGRDAVHLRAALDAAYAEMTRLSDMMNHYSDSSVVSAINRAAGQRPVAVPPELLAVLIQARQAAERSGGAFDITIGGLRGWRFNPRQPQMPTRAEIAAQLPRVDYRRLRLDPVAGTAFLEQAGMRIDLGGIAKLPILHAGMQVLERHGIHNAMLNGGGDIEVRGTTRGRSWQLGIRDGHRPEQLYARIALTRGFVVSSGDYERYFMRHGRRYHHILDPRTGWPTRGVRGVTLVAERMEDVNGLSAAVMVLGAEKGRALIEATPGLGAVMFNADGSTWVSPALETRIERLP